MILLVNGPNLNLLGEREPDVYGRETLADVERMVAETCAAYGVEVKAFQSNWEGALLDFLQAHRHEAKGVILNPGAFTHTSRALPDCLRALRCPTIEVHVSNVHAREAWRRESFVSPATAGQVVGLGVAGYRYAALHLCSLIAAQAGRQAAPAAPPSARPPVAPPPPPRPAGRPSTATTQSPFAPPPAGPGQAPRTRESIRGGDAGVGDQEEGEPPPISTLGRGDYEPL